MNLVWHGARDPDAIANHMKASESIRALNGVCFLCWIPSVGCLQASSGTRVRSRLLAFDRGSGPQLRAGDGRKLEIA